MKQGKGPATAAELSAAYREGALSPLSEAKRRLGAIKALNPRLNAFITVLADSALKAAEESESRYKAHAPLGPLDGVPVAVKDIIYINGVVCTAGSKILADNVAAYDAPVVSRLRAAGAIILGTTNLHEFAAGTTSVNPHYGPVKNPWDTGRVSGGSSGGSAAAVASGIVPVALGTDTAGSVRIPAALCGVLGLKPTYGRVSRLGVVPLSTSLDTVGILSRSAGDAAEALRVVAGHQPGDVTTVESAGFEPAPGGSPSAKVGVVTNRMQDQLSPELEADFRAFVGRLEAMGCSVTEVELSGLDEVYDLWLPIRRAEATAFHLRWLESAPGLYGDDVRSLLELGKDVRAVDYVNAVNARPSFMERFADSMNGVDAVVMPTTCVEAPAIGASAVRVNGRDAPVYSALNRLTLPFNYIGAPALSIPSGLVGGLPVGVQLVGKLFDEGTILGIAARYQSKYGFFPPPGLAAEEPPTG